LKEISLHILDIAENGITAGADRISINIVENIKKDRLTIKVSDNGCGMDGKTAAVISDPFVTTRKTRRVGLGIPFFKAAAEACDGFLKITSAKGKGTSIHVEFQHSHIDRMPLGNIEDTLTQLMIGYPEIDWLFIYKTGNDQFGIDSKDIKSILGNIPLSEPGVINYIREQIRTGIGNIRITE